MFFIFIHKIIMSYDIVSKLKRECLLKKNMIIKENYIVKFVNIENNIGQYIDNI